MQEIHENPRCFCVVFVPNWQTPTQTNPDRPRSSQTGQSDPNQPKPSQTCSTDPKPAHPNKHVCVCVSWSGLTRFGPVGHWCILLGPFDIRNVNNNVTIDNCRGSLKAKPTCPPLTSENVNNNLIDLPVRGCVCVVLGVACVCVVLGRRGVCFCFLGAWCV